MAKQKNVSSCTECGYQSAKWLGQCPGCGSWGSMQQETLVRGSAVREAQVCRYGDVANKGVARFSAGSEELDRVLGGGFVPGSLLLMGGDPGIGKSTLMLQTAAYLQMQGLAVLYVSGEESLAQVKLRGLRLGIQASELRLLAETSYESLAQLLEQQRFDVVFLDSIQTMYTSHLPSAPGSVAQIREVTARLLTLCKPKNITTVLVGHMTKDGAIAGPKTLEHMVDGVFYFEGDKYHSLRLVRAQKNRFGPAQELGIFTMEQDGLKEVGNPSQVLLAQRPMDCPGSVVVPCVEGTRPLMVEVQVLTGNATYAAPRRLAMGLDANRLALILAVLEKKAGLQLQGLDIFVNVVGGMTVQEPAIDLPLALAIYSAFRNLSFDPEVAVFGELGLAGEVRSVSQAGMRLKECRNLGFRKVILPKGNESGGEDGMTLRPVTSLVEALEQAL